MAILKFAQETNQHGPTSWLGSVHELNMRAVLDEPLKELRAEIGHLTAKRQNSDDQWLRLAVCSLREMAKRSRMMQMRS